MFRKHISTWAVLLLLLVALGAAAAAGCGGTTASSGSTPAATTAATTMSADQIVAQSEAKMKDVKSASFTGDMSLKVSGDPSKMTDPTTKAMLSQGVSLHIEGKSQNQPTAADMKISLGLAGQTIDLGLLSQGTKSWVEYQGKWYAMDAKSAKSLSTQAQTGAAPTEQLKSLGLNPSDWGTSYTLVGHREPGGDAGVPRQGDGRPAEAGGLAPEGCPGPEPRQEARRHEPAQAARAGPEPEQAAGPAAQEEPQERHRSTTGSAWTTCSSTRRRSTPRSTRPGRRA